MNEIGARFDRHTDRQADSVKLRPICIEDTDKIIKWRNQNFVMNNLYTQEKLTSEQHVHYYKKKIQTGMVKQFVILANYQNNWIEIGTTFLKNLDFHSKKAEFGIFIGENETRGNGFGTLATLLTVKYGFETMNLNRIYLSVIADNTAAIKAYRKVGFHEEGLLKQDFFRTDSFVDVIIMGFLREKWELLNKNGTN